MSETASPDAVVTDYHRYLAEIETYERWAKDWEKRGRKIVQRYRDERRQADRARVDTGKRFNILWSNVSTLQPALLARMPKAVVERRFKDDDAVARAASEVLERAVEYSIDNPLFRHALIAARDDRLLPGRGQAWVRYQAETEAAETAESETDDSAEAQPVMGDDGAAETAERLIGETVDFDYVHWSDFGHNPARSWPEVYLVWRRVQMTRADLRERFPECADKVPLDARADAGEGDDAVMRAKRETQSRAWVYELWDKRSRKVVWLSKGYPELMDEKPDPLKLRDFFPCPRPCYATVTTDTLIPVPDFALYQDQCSELDTLNQRRSMLIEACKVVGVYDGSQSASLGRLLSTQAENTLIPVNQWAAFAERGGMKGVIDWVPIDMVVAALEKVTMQMEVVKQQVYEITGIADIVRGSTQASETATAQEIKGRYANLRLSDMQGEVARFARDLIAIAGEIIAEHFAPQTIMEMTGITLPMAAEVQAAGGDPNAVPTVEAVFGLLRNDKARNFRVTIESDSTIAVDDQQNKIAAQEFLTAVGAYMKEALPAAQMAPELLPMLSEGLLFLVRQYRVGRSMEGVIEQTMQQLQQRAQQQAQQPQTDPMMEKVKGELDLKAQLQEAQIGMDRERMLADIQLQREAALMKAEAQREGARMQMDVKREGQQMQAEATERGAARADNGLAERMAQLEAMVAQMTQALFPQQQGAA